MFRRLLLLKTLWLAFRPALKHVREFAGLHELFKFCPAINLHLFPDLSMLGSGLLFGGFLNGVFVLVADEQTVVVSLSLVPKVLDVVLLVFINEGRVQHVAEEGNGIGFDF